MIIILGAGGHGWKSLEKFVENTDFLVKIYYIPADWGGFTGLFGKVLEFENNNLILHGKVLPILSFGDTNKLVDYFLVKKWGISLNTRFNFADSIENIIPKLEQLCDLADLESQEFVDYFAKLYAQIQNYLKLFSTEYQMGCIGNFWHQFLFYKFGSIELISAFYVSKEIFPSNLQICFSHLKRPILYAKDTQGNFLEGEDLVDIHNFSLIPSFVKTTQKVNPKLIQDLKLAKAIILPHGSICNWLPLVNYRQIATILSKKRVFALMNLFYLPNEFEYFEYMKYLFDLKISPIVIGPKIKHLVFDQKILANYKKQQKRLNVIQNLSHNIYFGALDIITQGKTEGIKHCPNSVNTALKMFIN